MKESVVIELSEKDIKQLVAERFNLDVNSATVTVSHYRGDIREPAYTTITVKGQKAIPAPTLIK